MKKEIICLTGAAMLTLSNLVPAFADDIKSDKGKGSCAAKGQCKVPGAKSCHAKKHVAIKTTKTTK